MSKWHLNGLMLTCTANGKLWRNKFYCLVDIRQNRFIFPKYWGIYLGFVCRSPSLNNCGAIQSRVTVSKLDQRRLNGIKDGNGIEDGNNTPISTYITLTRHQLTPSRHQVPSRLPATVRQTATPHTPLSSMHNFVSHRL